MKVLQYHIVPALILLVQIAHAQISPGPLTSAHDELEGIANCTKCHDLGKSVSSAKCLECHEEIQFLVDQKRGYHSSEEVMNLECFDCHSEHHGENFDMMRFDQDTFNHDLTRYILDGQHAVIDCRECHRPDYITDSEIRKREDTFLGLVEDCKSCHEDFHQGTLTNNNDCASCHDTEAFRPAPLFDHNETNYPLEGMHVDVECLKCHPMSTRNGKEFQEFVGIVFEDCTSCHEDPHDSQLHGTCAQCHQVAGFDQFVGSIGFDHNTTNFKLRGKHNEVTCFECHTQTSEPLLVFQDHLMVQQNDCIACHADVHEGRFGINCVDCHNEESWLIGGSLENFNHDLTDYPLEGRHSGVACKECHISERFTDPIAHDRCMDCHEDFHDGVFVASDAQSDCRNCHTLFAGFEETTYTIEQHADSEFPLEGAHVATPCLACHLDEENWVFRNIGSICADCHDDIHYGQFEENLVTDCARCHDSETWYPGLFDHDNTAFVLEGRHAEVECAACHQPITANGESFIEYKIKRFECADCHM